MISQEKSPLTIRRSVRSLLHDINDRITVLCSQRQEHTRHQGIVKVHMTLLTVAKIIRRIFRPQIGLGDQYSVLIIFINMRTKSLQKDVRLREVFTAGAVLFVQERNGR